MTQKLQLADTLAENFLIGAHSLAAGCPVVPGVGESLAALREVLTDTGDALPVDQISLTIPEALTLCVTTLNTMVTVAMMSDEEDLPPESAAVLAEIVGEMSSCLGAALRRENADRIRGLYVIIDPEVTGGRDPLEIAQAAVRGGAKMLQLRDKLRDKGEILPLAEALQTLCEDNDALLIVNDHVDLAASIGSGGVHVGQTDLPVAQARMILGPQQVLGRSNREIDLLIESQEMGADHVAFGAIYQTTTKPGGRGPQGPERLKEARAVTKVPLVAIGGITADNVGPVIEYGADAVCVTAAVGLAPEPEAAAARLVEAIRQAGGKV